MKRWHVALWVVQVLLAGMFLFTGSVKTFLPYEQILEKQRWVALYSPPFVKAIGVAELLGAVGLIAPSALRTLPVLTPIAASGLVLIMAGAAWTHLRIDEPIFLNVALAVLAVFVAWGRAFKRPISPR